MDLYEYEGKRLFEMSGIPVPKGLIISQQDDISKITAFPVFVKAQVLSGGRAKAGGIKSAKDPIELNQVVSHLIGSSLKGETIEKLLIEEQVKGNLEIYLSIMVDRNLACPLIMASRSGGIDVESRNKSDMIRVPINPLLGLKPYMIREVVDFLGLNDAARQSVSNIIVKCFEMFVALDLVLVEINPLIVCREGSAIAVDSKVTIDDYAVQDHNEFKEFVRPTLSFEQKLASLGLNATILQGEIAVITSGAGLLMATLDQISAYGGTICAAVDLGGGVINGRNLPESLAECLRIFKELNAKSILINAFFQLADCQYFAERLSNAVQLSRISIPITVRLKGRNDIHVKEILERNPIISHTSSFLDACKRAAH